MQPELKEILTRLEERLRSIDRGVNESWAFLIARGIMRGAAFTLGTAFAVIAGSWLLSVFGIIPGLGDIAERFSDILRNGQ